MTKYTYRVEFSGGVIDDAVILAYSPEEAEEKLQAGEWQNGWAGTGPGDIVIFSLVDEEPVEFEEAELVGEIEFN